MRHAASTLLLLALLFAVDGEMGGGTPIGGVPGIGPEISGAVIRGVPWVNPEEVCPSCSIFTDRPFMSSSLNEEEKKASVSIGILNESGVMPVEGATIFVYVYDSERDLLRECRGFTDEEGNAEFSYEGLDCEGGCTIKLYFCCADPVGLACVLSSCLGGPIDDYTEISACAGYEGIWPEKATVGGVAVQLFPAYDEISIPPRPEPALDITFVLCLPLLLVFGLLAGAMYASGRDPFAMFSFYTPRYTRGGERPIGGRGASISGGAIGTFIWQMKRLASGEMEEYIAREKETFTSLAERGREPGRVRRVAGTGRVSGAQLSPEERAAARATGLPGFGISRIVGGMMLGAEMPQRPVEDLVGMGFGATMMNVLALMLRYSTAPWLTGSLAEAAEGLAAEWVRERQAEFGERTLPAMLQGTRVHRDANGNITRIDVDFTDPRTGERVQRTIQGVDDCAAFMAQNIEMPMQTLQLNNSDVLAAANREYNRAMGVQHPAQGAREMLRAEGERAGGPTGEALSAMQVLSDPNSTVDARVAAFTTLADADVSDDVRVAAFAAATEGMDYGRFAQFARSDAAVAAIGIMGEATGEGLRESRDGNLFAALSAGMARLDAIDRGRAEGQADTAGIGEIVANMRGELAECGGMGFGFREGTESAASRMAAVGLSIAAMGQEISMEAIDIDRLSPEVREELAELEARSETGDVSVGEMSGRARGEVESYLGNELREALVERYGESPTDEQRDAFERAAEGKPYAAAMAAFGNYDSLTGSSVGLMGVLAEPGLDAARDLLSQEDNALIGPGGTIRLPPDVSLPYRAAEEVAAAFRDSGVQPEIGGLVEAVYAARTERANLATVESYVGLLSQAPSEHAAGIAQRFEAQQEEINQNIADLDAARRILSEPSSSEASRDWAIDTVAGIVGASPEEVAAQPEATEMIAEAYGDYAQQALGQLEAEGQRFERAAAVIAMPTEYNAAEYARYMADSPQMQEEREGAHQAVETLRTSTDEAERAEAERMLRTMGTPDAYLQPLVEPPPGTPAYQEALVDTAVDNTNSFVDQHFDSRRAAEVDPDAARRAALNYVVFAPENAHSQTNRELMESDAEQMAGYARGAAAERRFDRDLQIALSGPEAVATFYRDLDHAREVAQEAERVAQASTTETELGMPMWTEGGTSAESTSAERGPTRSRLDHRPEE